MLRFEEYHGVPNVLNCKKMFFVYNQWEDYVGRIILTTNGQVCFDGGNKQNFLSSAELIEIAQWMDTAKSA